MGYIYKIVNSVNGKVYIGQTQKRLGRRWTQHKNCAKRELPYRSKLYDAMRKYGYDSFSISVVEECENDALNEREIFWIEQFDSINNGYNIAKGGMGHISEARPIAQFDLDGNYIKTYSSAFDAAEAVGSTPQAIYNICYKYYKSYGGYQWRFLDEAQSLGMKLPKHRVTNKCVPVYQYDVEGNYIRSYHSIGEAASQFGIKGTGGIRGTCEGRSRLCRGYRWSYDKVDRLPPIRKSRVNRRTAMVGDDGEIIKVYETTIEAAREFGVTQAAIASVCNGVHEKCAGHRWKFIS